MKASDFKIGDHFWCDNNIERKVTDVGSRVVVCIQVTGENPLNLLGPIYSVVESVWDEDDLECVQGLFRDKVYIKAEDV